MASFGFGELPDAGGTDVFSARKRGKPHKSHEPRNEMPEDQDSRLKLPRGQLPVGNRGKIEAEVKKNLPTNMMKNPANVRLSNVNS